VEEPALAKAAAEVAATGAAVVRLKSGDAGIFGRLEEELDALQSAGFDTVASGARLKVQVGQGAKGAQVTKVLDIDDSAAPPGARSGPSPAAASPSSGAASSPSAPP